MDISLGAFSVNLVVFGQLGMMLFDAHRIVVDAGLSWPWLGPIVLRVVVPRESNLHEMEFSL